MQIKKKKQLYFIAQQNYCTLYIVSSAHAHACIVAYPFGPRPMQRPVGLCGLLASMVLNLACQQLYNTKFYIRTRFTIDALWSHPTE